MDRPWEEGYTKEAKSLTSSADLLEGEEGLKHMSQQVPMYVMKNFMKKTKDAKERKRVLGPSVREGLSTKLMT